MFPYRGQSSAKDLSSLDSYSKFNKPKKKNCTEIQSSNPLNNCSRKELLNVPTNVPR